MYQVQKLQDLGYLGGKAQRKKDAQHLLPQKERADSLLPINAGLFSCYVLMTYIYDLQTVETGGLQFCLPLTTVINNRWQYS